MALFLLVPLCFVKANGEPKQYQKQLSWDEDQTCRSITGVVVDSEGLAIPGVKVTTLKMFL